MEASSILPVPESRGEGTNPSFGHNHYYTFACLDDTKLLSIHVSLAPPPPPPPPPPDGDAPPLLIAAPPSAS